LAESRLVFSSPVLRSGVSRSSSDVQERCEEIERELKTLIPAIGHLGAGRLTSRLCVRGGELMVDFELDSSGQGSFIFDGKRTTTLLADHAAQLADLAQIRASLQNSQIQFNAVAAGILHDTSDTAPIGRERKQRELMKKMRGRTLRFDSLQQGLQFEFPDTPKHVTARSPSRIQCRIESVGPSALHAVNVTILDSASTFRAPRWRQTYRVDFPTGYENLDRGVSLLKSAFRQEIVQLEVYVCHEPLLRVVSHFLIAPLPESKSSGGPQMS
jgi:hypothetical protein